MTPSISRPAAVESSISSETDSRRTPEHLELLHHPTCLGPIPVQPEQRVDHHEADRVISLQPLQQLLVALALLDRGAADTRIDQLVEDGEALLTGLLGAKAALCRQAHACRIELRLNLAFRRDTEVCQPG
jgi:hypothetical protein